MRTSPRKAWAIILYVSAFIEFSCGRKLPEQPSSPSIVGGRVVEAPPYMAGLVDEGGSYAFCGGSFIAPQVVVTAAHCVEDMQKKIRVSAGVSLNSQHPKAQLIPVEAVYVHPDYDKVKLRNDIALLFLAPYDASTWPQPITPISLNTDGKFPDETPGTRVTVTGWGNTTSFGKLFDDPLRSAELDVIPVTRCSLAPGYDDVTDSQICAGDLERGGIDACNGDSGGPLVAKKADGSLHLVGVVSWGEGCALAGKPGVYTRISAFKEWIDATMSQRQPRTDPLTTTEIKGLLNAYCYDGWAYTKLSEDSSHLLEIATKFRIDGDFQQTSSVPSSGSFNTATLESNLPLCRVPLGGGLTLSGAVILSPAGKPQPQVQIVARQESPFAVWTAPGKQVSKLSLTCKDQPMSLRAFTPSEPDAPFSYGTSYFDILNEETGGLQPDDERHTCSYEDHSVTYAVRTDSSGGTIGLLQVSSPLFGSEPRTYRLAESSSSKPKIEMRFRPTSDFTGNLAIENLTDDDIHTWRLECNVAFGLIDEFGSYYPPLVRDGSAVHHFARPSHFFATIRAGETIKFTYDGRVPLDQTESLKCRINNQSISLKHDALNPLL